MSVILGFLVLAAFGLTGFEARQRGARAFGWGLCCAGLAAACAVVAA